MAALLIEKGADPNKEALLLTTFGADTTTPLKTAQKRGNIAMVELFMYKTIPTTPEEEAAFAETAAKYRAVAVKPALPEEARKFKVQAEFALNKKEFEKAAELYKEALDIAPWWPEGHFNRALMLGELSRYRDAIREMKRYLALVPDAPNARAAQDKIYQWEGEMK